MLNAEISRICKQQSLTQVELSAKRICSFVFCNLITDNQPGDDEELKTRTYFQTDRILLTESAMKL